MTTLKLHNTKTRKREEFTPIDPENVRMYVCGPTVYDRAHLGNARPVLVFDVLYRLLRHIYGADHVTYVRNFTDVDDRINETAQKRKAAGAAGTLEELIASRADETIRWYHEDMDALGALRPDHEPRATGYIAEMIAMIEKLIADGFAYAKDGHALFRVRAYADYGKLSGRSVDDMIAGARVEVAPYKEDPMDFVLWKPSPDDLPGWDSPWGRGRPGWHIECSAMAHELLGAHFDIHGGGNDLMFPHHENEIAQSSCAGDKFANYWMHNEMLQVEGKKMSKSLGNFFTVRDLLDQGVPGEVIRFVMLSTHYRKPMDWTEKKREEAEKALDAMLPALKIATEKGWPPAGQFIDLPKGMQESLSDDLNTSAALMLLRNSAENVEAVDEGRVVGDIETASLSFLTGLDVLGLYELLLKRRATKEHDALSLLADKLNLLRVSAMTSKDFGPVDKMKAALLEAGVEVRMSKDGVELSKKRLDTVAGVYGQAGHAGIRGDIDEQEHWLEIAHQMGENKIPHAESQDSWIAEVAKKFLP